jgi:radical SAM-linked protein
MGAKSRAAFEFVVDGDLRFLSHQETMRMLVRAFSRAEIHLRHTKGFNPHPILSLPLPRPVGIASDAERVVVELDKQSSPDELLTRLAKTMPVDITMKRAWMLDPKDRCVPLIARYRVDTSNADSSSIEEQAEDVMRFKPIFHDRFIHKTGKSVRIDLRPFIDSVEVQDGQVQFALHVTGGGSVRPAEVCEQLGIDHENINHMIRRTEVEWHHAVEHNCDPKRIQNQPE